MKNKEKIMFRAKTGPVCLLFPVMLLLACLVIPAHAGDGRFELNHEAALKGIPAIGDTTPGYPITITQPGSYVLTGDLAQPDPATDVVVITSDDVTIDLNGFTISGSNTCTVTLTGFQFLESVDCVSTLGGYAIDASDQERIAIHDGIIHGISGSGIKMRDGIVHDIQIRETGGNCIWITGKGLVRNVQADICKGFGIDVTYGIIESSQIVHAEIVGLHIGGSGSMILRSRAFQCGGYGISAGTGTLIRDCGSVENNASGILAGSTTQVFDCIISYNRLWGIHGGMNPTAYSGNTIFLNDLGTVTGTGMIETGTNICGLNTTCP